MSEPINYAANSHKSKAAAGPEGPHVERITTSDVTIKSEGILKKIRSVFFGGEFKSASLFVASNVVFPGLRDMLYEAGINGWKRMVYGERYSPHTPESNTKVQYNNPLAPRAPVGVMLPGQPPHVTPSRVNSYEANAVIIANKEEAEMILDALVNTVEKYGYARLSDFYEMVGLPVSPIQHKWGWKALGHSNVIPVQGGYSLALPEMEALS